MENHVNSAHEQEGSVQIIESLKYTLPDTASYILERRNATFFAKSNDYSPQGIRVIQMELIGDGFADLSTLKIVFRFTNTSTGAAGEAQHVIPISLNPAILFYRFRAVMGGIQVEDINNYNHWYEAMHMLLPEGKRLNDAIEGFSVDSDLTTLHNFTTTGSYKVVSFTPLSGLVSQDKLIPLKMSKIILEFELVGDPLDVIADTTTVAGKNWKITDVQAKCDIVQIDSSVENEYTKHVLAGEHLPITFSSFHSQMIVNPTPASDTFSININRSLTRIKTLFVTFYISNLVSGTRKKANAFHHPMYSAGGVFAFDPTKEVEFMLQIGNKTFPTYSIKSNPEFFTHLKKSVGIHYSNFHNVNITAKDYYTTKFIIGYDLEKILERAYSGLNTKAGDLITLQFKNCTGVNEVYCLLHYDSILQINDNSISLFD